MKSLAARFWPKVDFAGPLPAVCPELGVCWIWTGARASFGHGNMRIRGQTEGAHRVSFELSAGRAPRSGLMVLHRCNNPPCVNPSHLYEGTQKDNMRDRDAAGRHGLRLHPERAARGVRNAATKLRDEQVEQLRELAADGWTQRSLADRFGIGQAQVCRIVNRQRRAS